MSTSPSNALSGGIAALLGSAGGLVRPSDTPRKPALGAPRRMTAAQSRAVRRRGSKQTEPAATDEPVTPESSILQRFAETWNGVPQMVDQYRDPRYRETWQESSIQMAVFNILVPEDLQKLNDLLEEAEPPGAPQVVVVRMTAPMASPTADALRIVVSYRRIAYRDILQPTDKVL